MKAGAFTQIYIQLVISVKYKDRLLPKHIRDDVSRIIGGILNELGHKPIIINGVEDHLHIFYGHNPNVSLSNTVKELKRRSTIFINKKNYFGEGFRWQNGYGAFSYSRSHIEKVYDYIARQEIHHMKRSFETEYTKLLEYYEIAFESKYLFKF